MLISLAAWHADDVYLFVISLRYPFLILQKQGDRAEEGSKSVHGTTLELFISS